MNHDKKKINREREKQNYSGKNKQIQKKGREEGRKEEKEEREREEEEEENRVRKVGKEGQKGQ